MAGLLPCKSGLSPCHPAIPSHPVTSLFARFLCGLSFPLCPLFFFPSANCPTGTGGNTRRGTTHAPWPAWVQLLASQNASGSINLPVDFGKQMETSCMPRPPQFPSCCCATSQARVAVAAADRSRTLNPRQGLPKRLAPLGTWVHASPCTQVLFFDGKPPPGQELTNDCHLTLVFGIRTAISISAMASWLAYPINQLRHVGQIAPWTLSQSLVHH